MKFYNKIRLLILTSVINTHIIKSVKKFIHKEGDKKWKN